MSDNVTLPGTGAVIATEDDGSRQYQLFKVVYGASGTRTLASAANPLPTATSPRLIVVTGSTVTRPSNTTPYSANDAVSNNATAGSVTAISFTITDVNDAPVTLERIRIDTTDTGVKGKGFRVFLYQSDPTASSGIVGGDNAAFSTKKGTFIGTMVGTFRGEFSDGAVGEFVPEMGARIITDPTSGAQTVYALLETLEAFTPSANSTTFIPTLEAFQGRA